MEILLERLYKECIVELESIGIFLKDVGMIDISIAKRNTKRYGCCKQECPDISTKYYEKIGRRKYLKYEKYNKHHIEISKWVLELDEKIIKNTIMHEIIHCLPRCNNHGKYFKEYAKFINYKLGYNISRLGNVEEDYKKSNKEFKENTSYNYKIECPKCGQIFYRKRLNKNFTVKYRCGKCDGKFIVYHI